MAMLFPESPPRQIKIPASLLQQPAAEEPRLSMSRRKRDFARRMNSIVALRHGGSVVAPVFTDAHGIVILDERATAALLSETESAVRELARGRTAHVRQTVVKLEASRKSDAQQVEDLLAELYANHGHERRGANAMDDFLDTFEGWLNRGGVARVDMLFDRIDLDRAPPPLSILLLAMTRLTRACFTRRDPFLARLSGWLIGRDGRTAQDVDNMLRGLRE